MSKVALFWKTLAALVVWPVSALMVGFLASATLAYGKAAFVVPSLIVGGVGAFCQIGYFVLRRSGGIAWRPTDAGGDVHPYVSVGIGDSVDCSGGTGCDGS